jgi:hypothetical protein
MNKIIINIHSMIAIVNPIFIIPKNNLVFKKTFRAVHAPECLFLKIHIESVIQNRIK